WPTASLYGLGTNPSNRLMRLTPSFEMDIVRVFSFEKTLTICNDCSKLTGNTVVARLLAFTLCVKVRSSELIVTDLSPWITGALSLTKSKSSKLKEPTIVEPNGIVFIACLTMSFTKLIVFLYAPVTAVSKFCPCFQLLQKKNVVGSGK